MKKIILYILIFTSISTSISYAAIKSEYKLLEPLPCIDIKDPNCSSSNDGISVKTTMDIDSYISYVYRFSIALAVFLTIVMIVIGGFEYMLSESITTKGAGKKRIQDALLGLGGVLISYTILQTIDPRLVKVTTEIPPLRKDWVDEANKGYEQFVNNLSSDMQRISLDSLAEIKKKEEKIKENKKKIAELEKKISETNNPEEKRQLENDKASIEQDKSNLESRQSADMVRATSVEAFKYAISLLDDLNNYSGASIKIFDNKKELEKAKKTINDDYNKYLSKMTVEDKQQLKKEKDFYMEQIEEEKNLFNLIINYRNSLSPDLSRKLKELKNKYDNNKEVNTGNEKLNELYKNMNGSRIQKINTALEGK